MNDKIKLFFYRKSKKIIKNNNTPKRLYNLIINRSDTKLKLNIIKKRLKPIN
jgi:hypothetical protein